MALVFVCAAFIHYCYCYCYCYFTIMSMKRPHFEWHLFLSAPRSSIALPPPCKEFTAVINLLQLVNFVINYIIGRKSLTLSANYHKSVMFPQLFYRGCKPNYIQGYKSSPEPPKVKQWTPQILGKLLLNGMFWSLRFLNRYKMGCEIKMASEICCLHKIPLILSHIQVIKINSDLYLHVFVKIPL